MPPEYCIRHQLETFILGKRRNDEPLWLTAISERGSLFPFVFSSTKNRGVFYEQTVKAQVSFSNLKSQKYSALCSYPVTILQSPVITLSGLSLTLTGLQQPFAKHVTSYLPPPWFSLPGFLWMAKLSGSAWNQNRLMPLMAIGDSTSDPQGNKLFHQILSMWLLIFSLTPLFCCSSLELTCFTIRKRILPFCRVAHCALKYHEILNLYWLQF